MTTPSPRRVLAAVLSATGLARALIRSYRATWSVRGRRAGAAATGWQIGTVLLLIFLIVHPVAEHATLERFAQPG